MRFGLIAYPKKPIIIAHSGVSRETRSLIVVRSLLQLAYFVYARSKSPGEVMQVIVLIFNCGPLFYFLIQYYNLSS